MANKKSRQDGYLFCTYIGNNSYETSNYTSGVFDTILFHSSSSPSLEVYKVKYAKQKSLL